MKTKLLSLILIVFTVSNSCKKDKSSELFPCRAIVSGKSGCTFNSVYVLKFINGKDKAISVAVGESGQGREDYFAVPNLPDELKINGLTIVLDIKKPLIMRFRLVMILKCQCYGQKLLYMCYGQKKNRIVSDRFN